MKRIEVVAAIIQDGEKISRKAIARHIGNAVPPKLGEAVGRSIIAACAQ